MRDVVGAHFYARALGPGRQAYVGRVVRAHDEVASVYFVEVEHETAPYLIVVSIAQMCNGWRFFKSADDRDRYMCSLAPR